MFVCVGRVEGDAYIYFCKGGSSFCFFVDVADVFLCMFPLCSSVRAWLLEGVCE